MRIERIFVYLDLRYSPIDNSCEVQTFREGVGSLTHHVMPAKAC